MALSAHVIGVCLIKNRNLSRVSAYTHFDDFNLRVTGFADVLLIVGILKVFMRHSLDQMIEHNARFS